jgi:hypothetical protein
MPLGQELQAVHQRSPSPYFPEQAHDIPYPQPHSGVSGAEQFHPPYQMHRACVPYPAISPLNKWCMNGVDDDSGGGMYEEPEAPAMHDGHRLAKSPPTRPFHTSIGTTDNNGTANSKGPFLTRLFRKTTVDHPVKDPQLLMYPCRWLGCTVPVRGDQVARLGGFCCDTQMW